LQDLDGFGFVKRADFIGFFVLDGGLDASEDAEPELVLRAHGVGQVFLDFFGESHTIQYSRRKRKKKSLPRGSRVQREKKQGFDSVRVARYRCYLTFGGFCMRAWQTKPEWMRADESDCCGQD
jgi:hypothetical protein